MAGDKRPIGVAYRDQDLEGSTLLNCTLTGTATLPAGTTIGGSTVAALGAITSTATTGADLSVTNTGIYTGTGDVSIVANAATTGTVVSVSATGLTSGKALLVTAGAGTTATNYAASITSSSLVGSVLGVSTTGVYTGNDGVFEIDATALTTGIGQATNITGATSGIGVQVSATAATLTTGRYLSANDTTTGEVFGIGTNGHIISTVSASVPTIVVTAQVGITAAAITAGGSDTCGIITTTGTSTGATILDVTFGKTYTVAPKAVLLVPANAAAAMPNTGYFVSAVSATGFTITVAAGGTYAATPSWRYAVIG